MKRAAIVPTFVTALLLGLAALAIGDGGQLTPGGLTHVNVDGTTITGNGTTVALSAVIPTGTVSGTLTTNRVPVASGAHTLGDSNIFDNPSSGAVTFDNGINIKFGGQTGVGDQVDFGGNASGGRTTITQYQSAGTAVDGGSSLRLRDLQGRGIGGGPEVVFGTCDSFFGTCSNFYASGAIKALADTNTSTDRTNAVQVYTTASGGALTGAMQWRADQSTDFLSHQAHNLVDPGSAQDADTKAARDAAISAAANTAVTGTTGNLAAFSGSHVVGNYAGSSPSACSAGQAMTGVAISAAGVMTPTCTANVSSVVAGTGTTASTTSGAASVSLDSTYSPTFAGETLNGALNMSSHQINNVTDPASAQDADTQNARTSAINAAVSGTGGDLALFSGSHVVGNYGGGVCAAGSFATQISATGTLTCASPASVPTVTTCFVTLSSAGSPFNDWAPSCSSGSISANTIFDITTSGAVTINGLSISQAANWSATFRQDLASTGVLTITNNSSLNSGGASSPNKLRAQGNFNLNSGAVSAVTFVDDGSVWAAKEPGRFPLLTVDGATSFGSAVSGSITGSYQLTNAAASSTVPVFVPNKSDTTAGIGADATGDVSIITSGTERLRVATTSGSITALAGIFGSGGTSYSLSNNNATATSPTLIPLRTDTTTGIGANATGALDIIASGTDVVRVTSTAVTVNQPLIATQNDYRGVHREFAEDFLVTPGTNDAFTTVATGTGAGGSIVTAGGGGAGARVGVAQLIIGTTTTGDIERRTSPVLYGGDWTDVSYEATWGVSGVSGATDEYGVIDGLFANGATVTQTNGCYFLYDRGNVATGGINATNTHNLEAFSTNGGSRTRVNLNGTSQDGTTGAAGSITTCTATVGAVSFPNTGFLTTKVVQNGTSNCQFYVNGSLCTTLTTNIPASGVNVSAGMLALKSAGTTSKTIYLDRHILKIDIPSASSP